MYKIEFQRPLLTVYYPIFFILCNLKACKFSGNTPLIITQNKRHKLITALPKIFYPDAIITL